MYVRNAGRLSLIRINPSINIQEINTMLSSMVFQVIEENIPYRKIYTKKPFINHHNGKVSYDYSGAVERIASVDEIECFSTLAEFLNSIRINSWIPTYESNCGRHWISYYDLVEEKYNDWKYKTYDMFDEDDYRQSDGIDMEIFDLELLRIFCEFMENTDAKLYYQKLIKKLLVQSK